jgi:hypothetical protein
VRTTNPIMTAPIISGIGSWLEEGEVLGGSVERGGAVEVLGCVLELVRDGPTGKTVTVPVYVH